MNKKWFTLVEMLIVIVIIGILAAALIPRLTGIQARARDVARAGDLQQLTQALAIYALDTNGSYPAATSGSGTFQPIPNSDLNDDLTPYLNSIPEEGQASQPDYAYTTNGVYAAVTAIHEAQKGNWDYDGTIYSGAGDAWATPQTLSAAANAVIDGTAQIIVQ